MKAKKVRRSNRVASNDGLSSIFEIDGYGAVLPLVQNFYPVQRDAGSWCWGFKYTTGIFEFFYCKTKEKAICQRAAFIAALEKWHGR